MVGVPLATLRQCLVEPIRVTADGLGDIAIVRRSSYLGWCGRLRRWRHRCRLFDQLI